MSSKIEQKDKEILSFLNRDLERKALDRSVARDELSRKEEEENERNDD